MLGRKTSVVLIGVALLVVARQVSIAGLDVPILYDFGVWLERSFRLDWIHLADRRSVYYLLLIPTMALLIAVTRLTLGLRVLGVRSILISIGFIEVGVIPSLLLMAIVLGGVLFLQPRQRHYPLYGRVTFVLSLTAIIMLSGLMLGRHIQAPGIWVMAFFPVIIMAMIAEGVARSVAQEDAITAAWRLCWTSALAFVFVAIYQSGFWVETKMRMPEILVLELIAIIFVVESLDLRLFEDSALARLRRDAFTVVVVRNRLNKGVLSRLGRPASVKDRRLSQKALDGLREAGYRVHVIEGDMNLLRKLRSLIPVKDGIPHGVVINVGYGIQGADAECHVPAMLELAGIPYSGPGPIALTELANRPRMLAKLADAQIPVPEVSAAGLPITSQESIARDERFYRPWLPGF
ncbi:MAG: hypothetical protein GKR90_26720 [Pseudomonadales bacterium]|nr:hypothetical protein [Pseudomonadales bacterium]